MAGKLGRLPNDPAKPRLSLTLAESATLTDVDWSTKVPSWPMYGNDVAGDCVEAAYGHAIEAWTANASTEVSPTDAEVIAAYSALSGYDPATGAHDDGTDMQTACGRWRKQGLAGHKILAFAELQTTPAQVHAAVATFGGAYIGIACPQSALDQFDAGQPWTVIADSPIAGGHCILLVGYEAASDMWLAITWGGVARVSGAFMARYLEEVWVLVTDDWVAANGATPAGEAVAALGQDFTRLTGEASPFPQPAPTPQPVPPVPGPAPAPAPAPDAEVIAALDELDGYAKSGYAARPVRDAIGVVNKALRQ